ncbi:MAG: hypothetical protein MI919_07775, partial [Holophagales bacterium]|nr:hypothetical protein [Holophagales bacterium]
RKRASWRPWGIDGSAVLHESYSVVRIGVSSFHAVGEDRTFGAGIALYSGRDLDRFSRLRSGRSRAGIVGFDTNLGFDDGLFLNLTHGTSLFSRLPINLRLDAAHQRVEGSPEGWEDRVGTSLRFLVNGPWATDLWPSIRYSLYSSVDGEEGDVSYGLFIQRRY